MFSTLRGRVQAPRTSNRAFTIVLFPVIARIHASGRKCGCDTPHSSEDVAADRTRRMADGLLPEVFLAAAHGAAYACGSGGAGAVLYWLIQR
ncbi:hypothetical protein ACFY2N_34725 [Streptomyces rubiginosohelvolus]|uniref:hypothetical protein n=1 Tax=Streptomyces rubiginosohelvolus TaxID=67362 RepID=UPI00369BF2CA